MLANRIRMRIPLNWTQDPVQDGWSVVGGEKRMLLGLLPVSSPWIPLRSLGGGEGAGQGQRTLYTCATRMMVIELQRVRVAHKAVKTRRPHSS